MSKYKLKIDLNVLNHLGLNLYSNVPAVLSELIANAWDADASKVEITISDNKMIINDNGDGMETNDINEKFLKVGFQRRKNNQGDKTAGGRQVMGRKGIGKLSIFSIAEHVQIYTRKRGTNKTEAFEMKVSEIRKKIEKEEDYHPTEIDAAGFDNEGTTIILKKIQRRMRSSLGENIKKRVARRFGVIGDNFKVLINGEEVTLEDRDYFHKLKCAFVYGDYDTNKFGDIQVIDRENKIEDKYSVGGWLGAAKEHKALQEGDENLNKISILVRGKLAQEDILDTLKEARLDVKYIIGEINADFLDDTEEEDIATSSRQYIMQNDERYIALRKFINDELREIIKAIVKQREEDAFNDMQEIPEIKKWLSNLSQERKPTAKKLFGNIYKIAIDTNQRNALLKHGMLAFEHILHNDKLQELESINEDNLESVIKLFSTLDEIEATWYYEITRGRLDMIEKLEQFVNDNALERIIQDHIYTHLWLLDPSWDRATEPVAMEENITKAFDKISKSLTEEEKAGRIDLRYKKITGKHIIIELKRASVRPIVEDLQKQVRKYINALEKQNRLTNDEGTIEAICLLGDFPRGWDEHSEKSMGAYNIRIVTYTKLLHDAKNSYKEYFSKGEKEGSLLRDALNALNTEASGEE